MESKNRLVWSNDVMDFLCKRCKELYFDDCDPSDCLMLEELNKCKIVDAAEVVRCKDCKHYVLQACACRHNNFNGIISMNGFCSYGERRNNE